MNILISFLFVYILFIYLKVSFAIISRSQQNRCPDLFYCLLNTEIEEYFMNFLLTLVLYLAIMASYAHNHTYRHTANITFIFWSDCIIHELQADEANEKGCKESLLIREANVTLTSSLHSRCKTQCQLLSHTSREHLKIIISLCY